MYNCIPSLHCITLFTLQMLAPKDFLSHRYFFVHANDNPIRSCRNEKVSDICVSDR